MFLTTLQALICFVPHCSMPCIKETDLTAKEKFFIRMCPMILLPKKIPFWPKQHLFPISLYLLRNYFPNWNIFWQLFNLWSVLFTTAACHVSKRPIWQPRKSFLFECVPWYCCQRKCHFDRAHNWGYYLWRHISFISKNLCFHKRNAQIWKKYCTEVWFTIIGNPSFCSLLFWYLGAWFGAIYKLYCSRTCRDINIIVILFCHFFC